MSSCNKNDNCRIIKYERHRKLGFFILLSLGLLLVCTCRLSFCQSDESFYLSLAHRLWCGDRLIIDEWHPVQFYAPILLPFYSLYKLFVPDGSGVYLYARVIYVLFSVAVSLVIYSHENKKHPWFVALVPSILSMLYSRANIQGPSYYNLCMLFCILAVVFLSDAKKKEVPRYVCSGIFCALAVLCNPYLAIFVIVGILVTLLFGSKWRRKSLYVTLGIAAAACVYCLRHIHFSELEQIVSSLSYILSDPAHSSLYANITLAKNAMEYWGQSTFLLALVGCLFFFLSHLGIIKQSAHTLFRITYLSLSLVLLIKTASVSDFAICFVISFPFSVLALPFAFRALLRRIHLFELNLYFTGLALAAAFLLASNTGLDAMTTGFCISSLAGILLIAPDGEKKEVNISKHSLPDYVLFACICICMLGVFSAHRFLGVYRDAPVTQLTERITEGPAAGLYTTVEHAEQYNAVYDEIRKLSSTYPEARVLFSKILPWAYLSSDLKCASFTAWSTPMNDARLIPYYSEHPMPDLVIIFAENVGEFSAAKFNNHVASSSYNSNSFDGPFYRYVLQSGSLVKESELMHIFILDK